MLLTQKVELGGRKLNNGKIGKMNCTRSPALSAWMKRGGFGWRTSRQLTIDTRKLGKNGSAGAMPKAIGLSVDR
jgi:hypothetical protein